ncbi:hypothetical protein EJB05_06273, partial [Eragrostis curvula]
MTTVIKALVDEVPTLRNSPLYLVAESYGGKYAATLGVSIARAVSAGQLNITLGGVVVGDSFISPEDFTLSYGPLLRDVSRLDDAGAEEANKYATAHLLAIDFTVPDQHWPAISYDVPDMLRR